MDYVAEIDFRVYRLYYGYKYEMSWIYMKYMAMRIIYTGERGGGGGGGREF